MIAVPAGAEWKVLVSGEQTQGRFAAIETRERPGAEPPRHVHHREDELIVVLDGRVTFDRAGERLTRCAGTWLFLARGCEHSYVVESAEARLLLLLSPAGLEDCLRELGQPDALLADHHGIERLVATAARYGVEITGPCPHS